MVHFWHWPTTDILVVGCWAGTKHHQYISQMSDTRSGFREFQSDTESYITDMCVTARGGMPALRQVLIFLQPYCLALRHLPKARLSSSSKILNTQQFG